MEDTSFLRYFDLKSVIFVALKRNFIENVISKLATTAGIRLKRYIPASRGRALPFQKKSTNVLVEVSGELKPKKAANETKIKTVAKKESK